MIDKENYIRLLEQEVRTLMREKAELEKQNFELRENIDDMQKFINCIRVKQAIIDWFEEDE